MKFTLFILALAVFAQPSFAKILYTHDWKGVKTDRAIDWLKKNKYELQSNVEEMNPRLEKDALRFSPESGNFSALTYRVEVPGAKKVRITWGVNRFHELGNYEKGEFYEALSVLISFGYEEQPSGSMFIPDLPYFLNIIFGQHENPEKLYKGSYFHKGGRVVCPGCGKDRPGRETLTEVDLETLFKKAFPGVEYPVVTAFTLTTDSKKTKEKLDVYVKKIEFLD